MKKLDYFEKQLLFIFLFTLITGALRKWFFTPGITSNIILLFQLILPIVLSILHQGFSILSKQNIFKFYFLFLLISAFNPLNLTIFHGIFGIILHLGFWWMLGYYYKNRLFIDVRPLFPWVILFCSIEIILGFVQYQLPADHFLNKYAAIDQLGQGQSIALVGDSVRITGTFSYLSGFTAFLIFLILFIWSLIRANYSKRIISFLLSGTIIATFMSGSRSSSLIIFIIIFLIIISEFTTEAINGFIKSLLLPIILVFLFFLSKGSLGFVNIFDKAYSNFDERRTLNAHSGEQSKRVFWDLQELFVDYRGKFPIFGVGLGSTYQGATSIFGVSDYVKDYGYYENELPRIVLEGGFFLLFFRVILFIWLLSWLDLNKLSKVFCFIIFIYAIPTVFNIYNSIFLSLGLIFLDNMGIQKKTCNHKLNF
jgi:hypothetical protein